MGLWRRRRWAALLAVLVSFVALAAKSPDAFTLPQFWAEDGVIFFAGQHGHDLPQLAEPYAGYLLAIPRLVAWVATLAPASQAPLIYNTAAVALGAMSIASLRVLGRWGLSFPLLVASVILTPTNGEVFGTITNVQWFTQFYLLAAVVRHLQEPPSRHPAARAAVMAVVAFTGPMAVLAAGAIAAGYGARYLDERRRGRAWLPRPSLEVAVLAVGGAVQTVVISRSPAGEQLRFSLDAVKGLGASLQPHVLGRSVLPTELFLLGCAALGVLAAWRFRRSPTGQRAAFVGFVVFVAGGLAVTIPRAGGSALVNLAGGDRYFVLPKAAFWWLAALALIAIWRRVTLANAATVGALLVSAVALAPPLARTPFPDFDWDRYATELDAGREVTVPLPPGWEFHCPPASEGVACSWTRPAPADRPPG